MSERAPTSITSHPNYKEVTGQSGERRTVSYESRFDWNDYFNLLAQKPYLPPKEFVRLLEQLDGRTENNLVSDLGERFNLEVRITYYNIVNGKLHNVDHDEPMEEVIQRGQRYRLRNGNPLDHPREAAEVIGFSERQKALIDGGKTLVSLSPPGENGSDYRRNFFDLDEGQTASVAKSSRFTMKIAKENLPQIALRLNPNYVLPQYGESLDVHFLKNPIATNLSRQEILKILHDKEKSMNNGEFAAKVETPTQELRQHYIKRLHEGASLQEIEDIRRSILKLADLSVGLDIFTQDNAQAYADITKRVRVDGLGAIVAELAAQELRTVATGCGLQEADSNRPWSVGEFGMNRDGYGTLEISCQTCGAHYLRTPGTLEPRCRYCSGTKGIACEPSEKQPMPIAA